MGLNFDKMFKGYDVPDYLKYVSYDICKEFNINGLSDPMYIVNVIAAETGVGDGRGNFNGKKGTFNLDGVAQRLKGAYGTKIKDINQLKKILEVYL